MAGHGGLVGYLGTNDAGEVENMIKSGDERAELILNSTAYRIKEDRSL